MIQGLKLKAQEEEDLAVLSAALEGAISSPGELGYSSSNRAFTMTASRFMWEQKSSSSSYRVRTGLYCSGILSVRANGISQDQRDVALELLSMDCTAGEDGSAVLDLNFAGGGTIRMELECIDLTLTDVGDPWETDKIPSHDTENINPAAD
ncbi:MAG: DUF2948 family protein [Sneathiellales bacterium]|nr:DUF2948 family protein [Sneathiellales bacterium]